MKKILLPILVVLIFSTPAQAGWGFIQGAIDSVRITVDPGHFEEKEKRKARNQLRNEMNKIVSMFNRRIRDIKTQIIYSNNQLNVDFLISQRKFYISVRDSIRKDFEMKIRNI